MEIECEFIADGSVYYSCLVTSKTFPVNQIAKIRAFKGQHFPEKRNKDVTSLYFFKKSLFYIPRGLHRFFDGLTYLEVSHCKLNEVSSDDLIGLHRLKTIDLSHNNLRSVPSNLFRYTWQIEDVDLSYNFIERMSSQLFIPSKRRLKSVNLQGNTRINASFSPLSFDALMKMIDSNCLTPDDEPRTFRDIFVEGFKELWISKRFSDFKIIAETKEFPVHKIVLATQSSVFSTMFETDMQERHLNQMTIEDFSADAVENFLSFLYTEAILDDGNAIELFKLASKYEIPRLEQISKRIILKNLDSSNALNVLFLGNLFSCHEMIRKAFNKIRNIGPDAKFPDYLERSKKLLEKLNDGNIQHNIKVRQLQQKFDADMIKIEAKHEKDIEDLCKEIIGKN